MVQYGSIRIRIIPQVARTATPRPAAGAAAAAGRRPRRPRRGPRPKQAPASQSAWHGSRRAEGRQYQLVRAAYGCWHACCATWFVNRRPRTGTAPRTTHHALRRLVTSAMGKNRQQRKQKQEQKRSSGNHCAVYSQKHIRMKEAAAEKQALRRRQTATGSGTRSTR
jgi:uncharacterized membrane protein YccC